VAVVLGDSLRGVISSSSASAMPKPAQSHATNGAAQFSIRFRPPCNFVSQSAQEASTFLNVRVAKGSSVVTVDGLSFDAFGPDRRPSRLRSLLTCGWFCRLPL